MSIFIETIRLVIRPFRDSDLEPFLAYRNDPEVARYQGWEVPYPRQNALEFIGEMKDAQLVPGAWLQLALELRETGETVGDLAIHCMKSDPRQAYLGYSLARAHWGKGYASEAIRALLDLLFGKLNLHRVVAECDLENDASWRLLERLGFRREAHLLENIFFKGAYRSEYHYAILEREC
ncbi:MAG: GNAT family N-acetyltransferase [Anaerolineales bacterium]|jgi:RimJ/RimL family protein N-acetyltransferase|nr:GNAT family N-acetyltransferase [Anaerolineales bacterium]